MAKSKTKKRVKIIKCSGKIKGSPEYWYRNMIGKEFEIHDKTHYGFYHWVKTKTGINVVNTNDIKEL